MLTGPQTKANLIRKQKSVKTERPQTTNSKLDRRQRYLAATLL